MPSFSYILVALVILLTPGPTNTLLAAYVNDGRTDVTMMIEGDGKQST